MKALEPARCLACSPVQTPTDRTQSSIGVECTQLTTGGNLWGFGYGSRSVHGLWGSVGYSTPTVLECGLRDPVAGSQVWVGQIAAPDRPPSVRCWGMGAYVILSIFKPGQLLSRTIDAKELRVLRKAVVMLGSPGS